jgi:hypothetical protein
MHFIVNEILLVALHGAVATVAGALIGVLLIQPFKSHIASIRRAIESVDPDVDCGVTKQLAHIDSKLSHAPLAKHGH